VDGAGEERDAVRPVTAWFFPALPASRIAVLRAAIYPFVIFDMFLLVNDVVAKSHSPAGLYRPLALERALHLPAPSVGWVQALRVVVVVACLIAAVGRLPRLAGWVVALGFGEWVMLGMSYGKVDHDHLALLTALFVLPTVGPARARDERRDERAGWAIRCIQLTVVATYSLSVWAKIRRGGWDWPTGATFVWAVERRGTVIGRPLLHVPEVLVVSQWVVMAMETLAPIVFFLRGRALGIVACAYLGFHLITYATISIHFAPLVICWLAFAPLEVIARRAHSVREALAAQVGPPPGIRSRLFAIKR
jgi:hypothetical protein